MTHGLFAMICRGWLNPAAILSICMKADKHPMFSKFGPGGFARGWSLEGWGQGHSG